MDEYPKELCHLRHDLGDLEEKKEKSHHRLNRIFWNQNQVLVSHLKRRKKKKKQKDYDR